MTSLEQNRKVHLARRLMRLFAPDFRIVALSDLPAKASALDLQKKTIEVSEECEVPEALAAILFAVGHLKARAQGLFTKHFGVGIASVDELICEGVQADLFASDWAYTQLVEVFRVEDASKLLEVLVWDEATWRNYYGANYTSS